MKVITKAEHWDVIVKRFHEFQSNPQIQCCSIPLFIKENVANSKKDTILNWWDTIEQQSIELALEYSCMLNTDITDCYGSIYTHTISWALHGKEESQQNYQAGGAKLLGDDIDSYIRNMSCAQSNGIPQGSTLMDFIAEVVLGYADMLLSEKIKEYNKKCGNQKIEEYRILRYRDDYRIFGNSQEMVVKITKMLTEVLQTLNFRINTQKTFVSMSIIKDSIKTDKYYWNGLKQKTDNLQKYLLLIHSLSESYPNSGSLSRALNEFYGSLYPLKIYKTNNIKVLISILVDIAYKSPRVYAIISAIIGKLLSLETDNVEKKQIYQLIKQKFMKLPNTGYLQIWLQRLTLKINETEDYEEPLCKKVIDNNIQLWNIDWAHAKIKKIFDDNPIIDHIVIGVMEDIPTPNEIKTFWIY